MSAPAVTAAHRTGEWRADPGFGVYVHIPFCKHRCHYCDFNTYEGQEDQHSPYTRALVRHIETQPGDYPCATSVFFGGGTPTMLAPEALARILQAVRNRVGIAAGAEVTVEANPETVDECTFEALLGAGFTRVSIGVQSLAPRVLTGLGRTHSGERALEALESARRAGVDDVNADLIYGSPWESGSDWVGTLERIVEAAPDHISAYALTVEEGTPLATLVATGRVPDVDPDLQADRHGAACEILGRAGFRRYEVSNWARPGRASAHNTLYWCAGDYLGFGAGAHGYTGGRRHWSVRLPRDFVRRVEAGKGVEAGYEVLGPDERAGEALMLGLRLTSGIDLDSFAGRFGAGPIDSRESALVSLEERGLLVRSGARLWIPEAATLLTNEVVAALL